MTSALNITWKLELVPDAGRKRSWLSILVCSFAASTLCSRRHSLRHRQHNTIIQAERNKDILIRDWGQVTVPQGRTQLVHQAQRETERTAAVACKGQSTALAKRSPRVQTWATFRTGENTTFRTRSLVGYSFYLFFIFKFFSIFILHSPGLKPCSIKAAYNNRLH